MLARTSDNTVRALFSSIKVNISLDLRSYYAIRASDFFELKGPILCLNPLENTFLRGLVKRACFEGLQQKSSIMTRVVWAKEPKTALGFEIGPPRQKL